MSTLSELLKNHAYKITPRELFDNNNERGRANSTSPSSLLPRRKQHRSGYRCGAPLATFKSTFAIKMSLMLFISGTGCWLWGINRQLAFSLTGRAWWNYWIRSIV